MDSSFWPQSASEWLSLIVQFSIIIAALWGLAITFILKPIESRMAALDKSTLDRLNGYGERVRDYEGARSTLSGKVETLERGIEQRTFIVGAVQERQAKLENMFEGYIRDRTATRLLQERDDREIIARLARIEANTNLGESLERLGETIIARIK
jgi:hypothetical protein